ncbi:hypothetical protein A3715_10480 [Oleiphilus sp. HI0009]|nr:hypothetical protein A3715_25800 [Oleiphilus sp. HI0009]KZX78285.1 hypothetical protein A3715_10480 [Oleiphilus sp. HI0009]
MKKIIVLMLSMSIIGCATVIKGTDQNITFKTEPEGAKVTVSGRVLGLTPLTANVEKGKNQSFTFEKEGYKTFTGQLSTSTEGVTFIAVLAGLSGFFSTTTDSVTGAIHEFSPDQYYVTLVKDSKNTISSNGKPKVRAYCVHNDQQLKEQITLGEGELVNGLLELVGETTSPENVSVIQKLLSDSTDILNFADKVIDFYQVQ